jgi:hypothetical protein
MAVFQTRSPAHFPGKERPELPRDLKLRARAIAKASPPRFIEGEREHYDSTMRAKRGSLTAEEYRRLLIEKWHGE